MLLKTKGKPWGIKSPIVGRIAFDRNEDAEILIIEDVIQGDLSRYKAILTTLDVNDAVDMPSVYAVPDFKHLSGGDIVVINSDGIINTSYRVNSYHNFLLFTERCNSNCLMCSQPPKDRDDTGYFYDIYRQMIPFIPKDCQELGITGGEPTLLGDRFFKILEQIKEHLPDTALHCLTNGRSFAWTNVAQRLGDMAYSKLMLGIPVYSDFSAQHDYIVQSLGAFDQTIQGLYNLAKHNVRIELRIVLHKQTIPRLTRLVKYIYKNLPFVEHIAFMGLENQGYTPFNIDKLWIDPMEYYTELSESMMYLSDHGLNVSLYNSQLCVTPKEVWEFSRRSISDWKNIYLKECDGCLIKAECGGFFSSNLVRHSIGIKPLVGFS